MTNYSIELRQVDISYREYSSSSKSIKTDLLRRSNLRHSKKRALESLDLFVEPGEVLGVIGRNGSGKSTLAKSIMGIVKPTNGQVIVRGSTTGLLALGAGINFDQTARENIKFVHYLRNNSTIELSELESEVADWTGLEDFMDKPLRTYSSGMLARFTFALETSYKPEVLVIDEVLSVGDFEFQSKSTRRMQKLIKSGATVIFVSHDLENIRSLCTRCIWIDKGKLIKDGLPDEVVREYISN